MPQFEKLTEQIVKFRDKRDWRKFHSVRNLTTAIAIEVAELQEQTLWKTDPEINSLLAKRHYRTAISDEIADVLIFALLLCAECGVDPETAIQRKLRIKARKYPIALARGKATKYTHLGNK